MTIRYLVPANAVNSSVEKGARLPQNVAHRGFSGKYPENTMLAFEKGIEVGANTIETDLLLSRDGVIVLSHDQSLERCYGVKKNVADCDWEYLKTLRTTEAPHLPMPRFVDVLEYLRQPGREKIGAFLDIKESQDANTIMKAIVRDIESVPIPEGKPDWKSRLVACAWNAEFVSAVHEHMPGYEVVVNRVDPDKAREFLGVPGVSFSIEQMWLMKPPGQSFLADAHAAGRQVFMWTVNNPEFMRWAIDHGVDGVVTNEPALFREVCEKRGATE